MSITKKLHYDIISSIYNVDDLIIDKYKKIYGKYPCIYLHHYNYIKRDENSIKLLLRKEKLNNIIK